MNLKVSRKNVFVEKHRKSDEKLADFGFPPGDGATNSRSVSRPNYNSFGKVAKIFISRMVV